MYPFTPWAWRNSVFTPVDILRDEAQHRDAGDVHRPGQAIVGYRVEATDGHIGSIDEASDDIDASYVVVDTGPWIFGQKVLLPAGTIDRADHARCTVYVDRTRAQIKDAPEYDPMALETPEYRQRIADYYGDLYRTPPQQAP